MRYAIISDIHANVDALSAVLADITKFGVDQVLCLGDLVGYNGFPRETLALLRVANVRAIYGNHDLMALARLPDDGCGSLARKAIHWTRRVLTDDDWWYLASLPAELRIDDLLCVHSAPGDPLVRLGHAEQFRSEAEALTEGGARVNVCFTGHSHRQQVVVVRGDGEVQWTGGADADLPRDAISFVNPGTVGHSRDSDPRAAYAIFDGETRGIAFRRVVYDRTRLLRRNRELGLGPPSKLQRMAARVLGYARP
ncbi:MAG TPA: metallophosphoesterase family protein [Gemmatimonadales bacterium]|jgi:predicted phosphodiesterase|nr:metallophosphoesterase family protein [Gemmatimonadales bacterium]